MFKKLIALAALMVSLNALAALDINSASEAELDSIKGVGPGTSSKILDERKKAPFKDWNDFINRVKGIGKIKAAKFSHEGVTIDGAPFNARQVTSPAKKTL
jgi:competence protein ComEA